MGAWPPLVGLTEGRLSGSADWRPNDLDGSRAAARCVTTNVRLPLPEFQTGPTANGQLSSAIQSSANLRPPLWSERRNMMGHSIYDPGGQESATEERGMEGGYEACT
jgi:hypothetical protein